MAKARLDWKGDELTRRLIEASRESIDEVTHEAAADAAASHEWTNRTGQLEEEVVTEAAIIDGGEITGSFGTTRRRGFYGLFHEEGTVNEFARPFLRPAADRVFPTLIEKIRRKLVR